MAHAPAGVGSGGGSEAPGASGIPVPQSGVTDAMSIGDSNTP
eukprot:CAMPEP_0119490878 /NCGR_PEP_ID=MMETSP1344-20130328/15920_1 /TAXON_ID=236787 /ORGANISM="Florenciella parvula, Strain CCMP2471" /LENGTH=41 /DNA_ID= /DNA_START= /DNA_END= /DNA_ORIENTATION=